MSGHLETGGDAARKVVCMCGKNIGYLLAEFLLKHDLETKFVVNAYEAPGGWYRTPRELGIAEIDEDQIGAFAPDLILVAFYDRILSKDIFSLPRLGCWNLHLGDAERYRGAYPNIWALWNGDRTYAVTIHKVNEGIDSGDILAKRVFPIDSSMTGRDLYQRMTEEGMALLESCFDDLISGAALRHTRPQDDAKAVMHYRRDLVHELDLPNALKNKVRALTFAPFPPPYFMIGRRRFVIVEDPGATES